MANNAKQSGNTKDEPAENTGGNDGRDPRRNPAPTHLSRAQEMLRGAVHGDDAADGSEWTPPSNLQAPPPRPGYVQRWIRVELRGTDDPANIGRQLQQGWKPRPADTVPAEFNLPNTQHGRSAGYIQIQGMVLCEMPVEKNEVRQRHYRKATDHQSQAIEESLAQQSHPKMPITQNRKSEARTSRRRPPVAS